MVSISPRLNPFKKTILVPPPLSGNYISILISSSSTCISINFYFYFLFFFLLRKTLETITEKNNYSLDKLRFEPISKGIINPSIALSLKNIGEERNFERPVNKSEESDRRESVWNKIEGRGELAGYESSNKDDSRLSTLKAG